MLAKASRIFISTLIIQFIFLFLYFRYLFFISTKQSKHQSQFSSGKQILKNIKQKKYWWDKIFQKFILFIYKRCKLVFFSGRFADCKTQSTHRLLAYATNDSHIIIVIPLTSQHSTSRRLTLKKMFIRWTWFYMCHHQIGYSSVPFTFLASPSISSHHIEIKAVTHFSIR